MKNRYRRVFSLFLALCLLLPLVIGEGLTVAAAENLGRTTADNVNVRAGAGSGEKIIFKAPNGLVCEILDTTRNSGKVWYKIRALNPENQRTYWGYVLEDYFRALTAEEAATTGFGKIIGTPVATPTPTPTPDPANPNTPTPTPTVTPAATPNPVDGNTPVSNVTGTIIAGGTNFREAPSMRGHSMLRFDRNTVVEIISVPPVDDAEHFYGVRYDGMNGYVRADCIRANNSPVTPTLSPVTTPTPNPAEVNAAQLILSSAHLRNSPGGTYDPAQDWVGKGSVLPLAGYAVEQGGYAWYPVTKNGKVYYVRTDCVQLVKAGSVVTPTPTVTPTVAPGQVLGYVKTIKSGCNLRSSIAGSTVVAQVKKNLTLPYLLPPVTKNNYTWYYVEVDGLRGYLRSDVVKVVEAPATATPVPTVTPTPDPANTPTPTPDPAATETPLPGSLGWVKATSNVNMRQKAGYTALIGEVLKGTVMPYYDVTTVKGVEWYSVQHPTMGKGYVHGNYVTIVKSDGSATPTPVPTATTPAITVTPGSDEKQEATYTTLRVGDTGPEVNRLVTALKQKGYYTGEVTSKYTTAVATAVKAFQRAVGLSVDGTAGAATQHALYGTVPPGTNEKLTMTIYPAEKVDWWTGGINELWKKGSNYKIYDVKTGIVWWCHRWSGGYHVDGEPLTAADTARLCKCYGVTTSKEIASKNLYQRRPCLVTIDNRTFACSLYGVPHNYPAGDTIANNEFDGQLCVHFSNSWTHGSKKVDSLHTEAIQYAYDHAPNGKK